MDQNVTVARSSVAALFVGVVWAVVIFAWDVAPLTLTVDDSYYYFQIARHVFAGDGLTFDGLQETTGFHPLWLLLLAPFGGLLDRAPDGAVRCALLFQLGLATLGVLALSRTKTGGGGRVFGVVAALALVFNFTKVFVNGMESALELVLLAMALMLAERSTQRDREWSWLGAVCGLLCLARLSAVPGAATLLVVTLRRRRAPAKQWALAIGQWLLPVTFYSTFLYRRTGHPFPVSAAIKYGHQPWLWHGPMGCALVLLGAVVAIGAVTRAEWRRRDWPIWVAPLVIWVSVQLCCDALVRAMLIPEIWYLVPHATLCVLGICELVRFRPQWQKAVWLASGVLAILVWNLRLRPETYAFYVEAKRVGEWLAENTPSDARVAGWDCGIAAFYSRRAFSNLDGLASSWNYKLEFLDRGHIREFLDSREVDYVAQYVPEKELPSSFHGVDLADWEIVYDQPFEFRGILVWLRGSMRHRYVILRRR